MRNQVLDLRFPLGGVVRRAAYQTQSPYTTPNALNVRPGGTFEDRDRGGQRPGTSISHHVHPSPSSPSQCNMLAQLAWLDDGFDSNAIYSGGLRQWRDDFNGQSIGDAWTSVSTTGYTATASVVDRMLQYGGTDYAGYALDAVTDMNQIAGPAYYPMVTIRTALTDGIATGAYEIWFNELGDGTHPADGDGWMAELIVVSGSGYTVKIYSFSGGSPTLQRTGTSATDDDVPYVFTFMNTGAGAAVWVNDASYIKSGLGAPTPPVRAGISVGGGLIVNGTGKIDSVELTYRSSTIHRQSLRKTFYANIDDGGTSDFYIDHIVSLSGVLQGTGNTNKITSDDQVFAQDFLQKLYIANHARVSVDGSDGVTATAAFTSASYTNWATEGVAVDDRVVIDSPATAAGTYKITSISPVGTLNVTPNFGADISSAVFHVAKGPLVFDPKSASIPTTLTDWVADAGKGQVPTACHIIVLYKDRLAMAGTPWAPHLWYMSRQGDANDWNFGADADDVGRAIAGTNAEAGQLGEPITALIPHTDDCMLMGGTRSFWIMRGNPASGGQIDNLSQDVGPVSQGAWTYTPEAEVCFLTLDGLYLMPAGCGATPTSVRSISRERLPDELVNVDANLNFVNLEYDTQLRGVWIFITGRQPRNNLHWWFDWDTRSFWPLTLPSDHEPITTLSYRPFSAGGQKILLGCRDGQVRYFNRRADRDGTTAMTSFIEYGPIKLGRHGFEEGMVSELQGVMAAGSGNVNWQLKTGKTAEQAFLSGVSRETGAWSDDKLNYRSHVRVRGGAVMLRVVNQENRRWEIEGITLGIRSAGRLRK